MHALEYTSFAISTQLSYRKKRRVVYTKIASQKAKISWQSKNETKQQQQQPANGKNEALPTCSSSQKREDFPRSSLFAENDYTNARARARKAQPSHTHTHIHTYTHRETATRALPSGYISGLRRESTCSALSLSLPFVAAPPASVEVRRSHLSCRSRVQS